MQAPSQGSSADQQMTVRTEADQISEEAKNVRTEKTVSYACMVILMIDFASALLLLWVAVHGHPCLGWVTVVGLVCLVMVGFVRL